MNPMHKQALEYVRNAGGNATVASLDDDFEPIGMMLRENLIPMYIEEVDGKLVLTDAGRNALEQ